MSKTDFNRITDWVFDLDNTLYPHHLDLYAQIGRRMTDYVAALLGLGSEDARALQRQYYLDHGLTLLGLMKHHRIDPLDYLEKVHAIDYSCVRPHLGLAAAIKALPGRKFVFTNASRTHADAVVQALGLDGHFDGIFDLIASGFTPKPRPESYRKFLQQAGIDPVHAAMFEDLPGNLSVPRSLGMVTVLVIPSPATPIPAWWDSSHARSSEADFVTDDLAGFLEEIARPAQP